MAKPLSSLLPEMETRLAGWQQLQYRLSHVKAPKLRPTITISREFGCEGFPLAERLKALFEASSEEPWNIYDKTLLEKVADEQGISMTLLQGLGDMSRALDALGLHPSGHVTHDEAFAKVAKRLVQIAKVGNAVIVGRGGATLCSHLRNCFHFRLEASFAWRVACMAKRLDVSMEEAEETVKINSKLRERFISQSLGVDIRQVQHYDAVFNNERNDVEAIAQAIFAYVKTAWPSRERLPKD
ncbi:MAG TPA: cytidylate kinase-like family protein [Holophaga sp.]|nr:cytidylate kinase-like family protein [Holophaga sp.]